jgi:hypothetical protein
MVNYSISLFCRLVLLAAFSVNSELEWICGTESTLFKAIVAPTLSTLISETRVARFFFVYFYTKMGLIHQITTKYTEWS